MRLRPSWTRWRAFLGHPLASRSHNLLLWTVAAVPTPDRPQRNQPCAQTRVPRPLRPIESGDGIDVERLKPLHPFDDAKVALSSVSKRG
jgi:hypothetical protein